MRTLRSIRAALVFSLLLALQAPVFAQPSDGPANRSGQLQPEALSPEQLEERMDIIRSVRENVALFGEIYRQVSLRYVDQVNPEAFMKAGIDGMLSTLDPYTEYIEPEGTDDLKIMSRGRYGGVGLQIGTRGSDRVLTVVSPIEGTPAWRLGVRSGDQILTIDGESTEGFSTSDAAQKLRGEPGSKVTIQVRRFGVDELLKFTITREEIQVRDVSFAGMVDEGIGYVRLTRFSRQAGTEVREAVEDLKAQGLKGLILDLRSNPGGLLPEAIAVSENFLHPGDPIVSTRGRAEGTHSEYRAENPPSLPADVPLIVLINEGSASASEIVAGAVQDLDRGLVIGQPSFGKGLVQSVINFNDGTALRITTAKYYTPSGRLIQKVDYFTDNESILEAQTVEAEDSLYYTTGGREVLAHGGIAPDIRVEMPEVGELVIALWRHDEFFDFASHYLNEHPDLSSWELGDEVFGEFRTWLDTSGFDYESDTETHLEDIRKRAEKMEYGEAFMKELADLEQVAQKLDAELFARERDEIMLRIKLEIASAIAGSAGRTKASLEHDPQIQRALEVLKREGEYASALAAHSAEVPQ